LGLLLACVLTATLVLEPIKAYLGYRWFIHC